MSMMERRENSAPRVGRTRRDASNVVCLSRVHFVHFIQVHSGVIDLARQEMSIPMRRTELRLQL